MVPHGRTEEESNTSCLSPRAGASAGPADSESASTNNDNDQQHVSLHECDRSRRRHASLLFEEYDLQQQQQHLSMYHNYRCGNYHHLSLPSKVATSVNQEDASHDYEQDHDDEDNTSTCQPPSVAATSTTSYCSSSFSLSSSSNHGGGGGSGSGSSSIDESFRSLQIEQPQQPPASSSTTTTARTSRSPSPSINVHDDDDDGDDNEVQVQQQAPMVRLVEDDEDMKNPALAGVLKDLQTAQDEHALTKDCHTKLAEAWNSLGLVRLHMQKDPSAALTCHEHALTVLCEQQQMQVQQRAQLSSAPASNDDAYCCLHEQINENQALTLHDMGQCFERLKDSTAALERYQDTLQILTVSLGYANDHYRVLSTKRAIDRIRRN